MINAVNEQFSRFVNFAQERFDAGKKTAIATKGDIAAAGGTPLEERAIYSTDKTDFVGMTILRTKDAKAANDEVRELFRKSIVDMFGGEGNIPDSVKDAMLLKDYGSGKPLIAAANEGGMATGTSSELPAVMLDKLEDFLAEDPYGNMEKVDKFCTYLENNGPAALHVADGKNVDLNWLYREVIG